MKAGGQPRLRPDRIALLVIVVFLSAIITTLQVAAPSLIVRDSTPSAADNQETIKPAESAARQATATTPAPAATPTVPSTLPPKTTAITSTYVNVRSGKSTDSSVVANLEAGTTVQLRADSDATWQGVRVGGKEGYIYKAYLQF